jgi:16S rRNA (cytidine1402-2'-O)-methyltransferase
MTYGTLIILPNSLGGPIHDVLPPEVATAVRTLDGLIAESDRGGRRFLEQFQGLKKPPNQIPIALFNEHTAHPTDLSHLDWLLEPIKKGETWGLVSDAGLPCLADPGSSLISRARQQGINVQVFSGPSAPILALLLSGLPAQRFRFHGYPPKAPEARKEWITEVAQIAETQICIEAPYRNQALWQALVEELPGETLLGIALDLTLPTQEVRVTTVNQWRRELKAHNGDTPILSLGGRPAVFLFLPRSTERSTPVPSHHTEKKETRFPNERRETRSANSQKGKGRR